MAGVCNSGSPAIVAIVVMVVHQERWQEMVMIEVQQRW